MNEGSVGFAKMQSPFAAALLLGAPLALNLGIPIMPLVLIAFFIVVLRRALAPVPPRG